MIDGLELHHLRTLAAVYRHGTLSSAAESLGVSQQALSLQLKRLRERLGDPVFVRTGRGMAPTAYGLLLRPHVDAVLASVNAIPRPQAAPFDRLRRTLSLSATDHAQRLVVAPLMGALRRAAPGVKVQVLPIEAAGLVQRMQRGEIDLVFTSNGYLPEGLVATPLFIERYVCVAARALAPPGVALPLHELVRHDFVVVSPGVPDFDGSAGGWFAQQGLQRSVVASVPTFFMAQEVLRRTALVAFLPSRLLPSAGLVEVPIEKAPPGYEVVAGRHPSALADPLLAWLLDEARALGL